MATKSKTTRGERLIASILKRRAKLDKMSAKHLAEMKKAGVGGTTHPAHVRINPRTGKTQVFVTPAVANKLRGVKGIKVAGNPTPPNGSASRIPVKLKYLIVTEHGKTFKATNKSEVNRMKAVLKNQGTKFKVTTLPKGSTTWNT